MFYKHLVQTKLPTGDLYEGALVANLPEGPGKITYTNGDTFEGTFKNGKFSGEGQLIRTTGDFYKGEYIDGLFEGQGILKQKVLCTK